MAAAAFSITAEMHLTEHAATGVSVTRLTTHSGLQVFTRRFVPNWQGGGKEEKAAQKAKWENALHLGGFQKLERFTSILLSLPYEE